MKKCVWIIIFIIILCASAAVPVVSYAETGGICGDNLTWVLDSEGTLIISGTGKMQDYSYDDSPFYANKDIKAVIIKNGVTSIGDSAFYCCSSLTSVTIPDSVTSIGKSAFDNCTGLTNITLPNSVTSIENGAFSTCYSLTSITIPDSVTSIKYGTFSYCSGLTIVTIPDSVTSIGDSAFYGCAVLTSVTIPDSVISIGDSAFSGCYSLTNVTIPNSVTSIGGAAFENCISLTSIAIPDSVKSIGADVFVNTGIYNNEDNWQDGVLYIENILIDATNDLSGEYIIKDGTRCIADLAFFRCEGLTSVTISNSVTNIGYFTFYGCIGLTSVTIPASVTSVGDDILGACNSLTDIYYTGSEAQWNMLGCEYPRSAAVHYNSGVPTPPAAMTVTKTENSTSYTFDVAVEQAYKSCYVCAAIYVKGGVLLNTSCVPLEATEHTSISADKSENDYCAKIFIWDHNMAPITYSETINL